MGAEHETQVAGGGPGDGTGAAPADEETPGQPEHQDEPVQPAVPAGEPEAPVGPAVTPPHGDPLDEPARESAPEQGESEQGPADPAAAKAAKADEYLELARRTKADFENYRKRASREIAAAQERGVAKLAKELLPGVDDLDRALEAAERSAATQSGNGAVDDIESQLVSGIKLVHADVIAGLARVGIERFSPHGERFDPQQHEAVAQQPVEGAESGTIVEVYQRGYRLGETVLRPARVVVAQ